MANWTNPNEKQKQMDVSLAYIKNVQVAMEDGKPIEQDQPIVEALANAVLDKAKEFMNSLKAEGLTTESKTRDGKTTYTDKAVVNVEPAIKWNKETQTEESIVHKDGSPVYKATAEIKHAGTILTLTAKEDISDGAKFVAMTASKWDRSSGSPKLNFYKQDAIATAPINKDIKQIAAFAQAQGFIEQREEKEQSALKTFAYEANQFFNANTEKVANTNGELVNNAYAKYVQDDYGEKVMLYNHTDNTAVELGMTSSGDKYAVAINFDLNRDFDPRQETEPPAKAYINKASDLEQFIDLPEIRDAVAEFKEFGGKEQEKEQPKRKDKEVA